MKLISYKQNEYFMSIRTKLIALRYLHECLLNYDERPGEILESLSIRQDIDKDKFSAIVLGLKGINTKDKTISLGLKYLKEELISVIDKIIADYKLVVENDQTLVVKDNVKNVLSEIMSKDILSGNIEGIYSSLPATEFANNTFIMLLEPIIGKGVNQSMWVDCLSKTLDNDILGYNTNIPYNDRQLTSFIQTKLTHIDNNKGNSIYVTESVMMNKPNMSITDTNLSDDIKAYITVTDGEESVLDKKVMEVCNKLFNIEDKLTSIIDAVPELDFILVTNILGMIRTVVSEYGDGVITKSVYNKLMVEYINTYIDLSNAYVNVNNLVINECIKINRSVKLAYMAKAMFENMLIEGSISYKG